MATLTGRLETYARWLGSYFYVDGYAPEDLAQEARIAMIYASEGFERRAARLRVIELLRRSKRGGRPQLVDEIDTPAIGDLVDVVDARMRLRRILEARLTANERIALGRTIRGEPIRYPEKTLQSALRRAREKLAE